MALWRPYADDFSLDLPKLQVQGAPAESSSTGNSPQSPHPQFLENCPPQFPGNCPPQFLKNCPPQLPGNYAPQLPGKSPPQFPENCPPQLPVSPYHASYGVYYGAPLVQVSPSGYDAVPYTRTTPPESSIASTISDDPEFKDFEENALRVMAARNGGALVGSNPRMRRCVRASSTSAAADDAYLRQRERNNLAAKLSRDRRKRREVHLALQVAYLHKQVAALKANLSRRACVRCHQPCLC
ncbi:hypothetical protein PYW08_011478 [Mythimna loreyi]|uniref:Uncharacterized protein n=1 Tax=Mythimna loreyi TaxID=667449 RepID=A0ACC2QKH3_9NEOP|nr:hypothetical protein PYW08_011478 [Mythimna loreyi]